jgi:hypothetical protein
MSSHLQRPRRLSRPTAPSCRGGASSLLRLAQPSPRNADFLGLMHRAAEALAPLATTWPQLQEAASSIITPLAPSRNIGAR